MAGWEASSGRKERSGKRADCPYGAVEGREEAQQAGKNATGSSRGAAASQWPTPDVLWVIRPSLNITNPRKHEAAPPKKGLTRWSLAYVVGGALMVVAAHYASMVIPLGR